MTSFAERMATVVDYSGLTTSAIVSQMSEENVTGFQAAKAIRELLAGERSPTLAFIHHLAILGGVDEGWLLTGVGQAPTTPLNLARKALAEIAGDCTTIAQAREVADKALYALAGN